jgi:lipoprotein-anchoring transpeptidase ErfK/SrfK
MYNQRTQPAHVSKHKFSNRFLVLIFMVVVILAVFYGLKQTAHTYSGHSTLSTTAPKPVTKTAPVIATSVCDSNNLSQLILVSISQRHLWACDGKTVVYDSSVITGMSFLAADLTPTGTYHVYAKETNLYLKGCDSTGCWNDYVNYWMPFLDNQYGEYGFHDATWRTANEFGNISPNSTSASHGCVEMPLAAAKWLYGWAVIGTTVQIEA